MAAYAFPEPEPVKDKWSWLLGIRVQLLRRALSFLSCSHETSWPWVRCSTYTVTAPPVLLACMHQKSGKKGSCLVFA